MKPRQLSLDPGIRVTDEIGRHAVKCMRRILEIGYQEFLEAEFRNPSREDADWHKLILEELALRDENKRLGRPVTWRPQEWAYFDRMRAQRRRDGLEPPASARIERPGLDEL